MDKKKKYIILISLIIFLVLVGTFICIDLFSKNSSNLLLIGDKKENTEYVDDSNDKEDNDISGEDDEVTTGNSSSQVSTGDKDSSKDKENNSDDKNDKKNNNDKVAIKDNDKKDNNDNVVIKDKENNKNDNDSSNIKEFVSNHYSEEDVVSYFENMETEVESSKTFKEKFKEYFITVIDFIFYDKEIKGYTFSEISGTAKTKIIAVALKIDSKIEEYVPNYKENISSTSSKIYTNVKEKLVTLYMDIATDICSGDNENECARVKEIFGEVKNVCKIGWEFIKNLVSNGVTKIKEWYEIYSGK